jgi:rRNA-processing protein FCF1
MQVKDLTIDELKALIRETVIEALEALLPDPDEGAVVREDLKRELLEIRKRRETGVRGIPADEVMQKLGLGGR